jgi:hypothetical protein
MPRSTVAALRTSPDTVLADLARLADLAGLSASLRNDLPTRLVTQRDVAALPGAHSPDCPVFKRIDTLKPAWRQA